MSQAVRNRLRKLLNESAVSVVATEFKISVNAFLRYLADVQYTRGTASIIESTIDNVEKSMNKKGGEKK
jgi:hypothetical protein